MAPTMTPEEIEQHWAWRTDAYAPLPEVDPTGHEYDAPRHAPSDDDGPLEERGDTTARAHAVDVHAMIPGGPSPAAITVIAPTEATPPPPVVLDQEQIDVLGYLIRELFVNLSGTAGVGKTTVAKALIQHYVDHEEPEAIALCATTGIAAVNLGEGTTINSLLGYYDTASLRESYMTSQLTARLRRLQRAGLRKILLDEKSMLDAHQLTILVRAIDEVNTGRTMADVGGEHDQRVELDPSEAIGLILVGDFGQLPPVKAPFAFESAEWPRFADHTTTLRKIRRQTDLPFIEALHAIRRGDVDQALGYFTAQKFSRTSDDQFPGTTIFATNDAVDRYNRLRLDQVRETPFHCKVVRWGEASPEWEKIPYALELRVGALVMILANRRNPGDENGPGSIIYANGDQGVIVDREEGEFGAVLVRLHRTGRVERVKWLTREKHIPLEPGRRKELRDLMATKKDYAPGEPEDKITEDGKHEIVGTVTYMPLRVAYGVTVHKSQGLTLDQVQININEHFFGKPGMLFVALSRARTPQGLVVIGNQQTMIRRCAIDPKVQPWL